jgi:hypothetical protein
VSNVNVSECLDGRTEEDGRGGQCITIKRFKNLLIKAILGARGPISISQNKTNWQ